MSVSTAARASRCAELVRRKVPFCLLAEENHGSTIPLAFRGAPLVTKPVEPSQVRSALVALVQPGPGRGNLLLQRLGDEDWMSLETCLERVPLRAGVTVAMHALEGRQALRSERRGVRLLDRPQLEAAVGGF